MDATNPYKYEPVPFVQCGQAFSADCSCDGYYIHGVLIYEWVLTMAWSTYGGCVLKFMIIMGVDYYDRYLYLWGTSINYY